MADIISSNALLDDDEKKKQQDLSGGSVDELNGSGTSGVVSGGGSSNSLPTSGGNTQPWTNIQAYLGANKDNNSSSKLLEDNVGGALDTEQKRFDKESTDITNQGKTKAEDSTNIVNQFQPNLDQSAGGAGNSDYSGKANSFLNSQFGIQSYTFATDGKAADSYNNLKKDDTFYNQQNDLYKKATGGQLSSGQGALQTQLDTNNENLANMRSGILKKYTGITDDVGTNINKVNTDLNGYQNTYDTNRSNFGTTARTNNSSLNTQSNAYQNQINDINTERQNVLNQPYWRRENGQILPTMNFRNEINNEYDQRAAPVSSSKNANDNKWNYIKSILGA
jgi:predicted acetyltransferase